MSLEESRRSQRPYRYGMVLLCVGALINWLGLAENYVEPVRYVGVACIVAGALLICAAMCCWLHAPPTRTSTHTQHTNHPITAQVSLDSEKANSLGRERKKNTTLLSTRANWESNLRASDAKCYVKIGREITQENN